MDEPETWRWIWLGAAVLFGVGEMATPGAFFLAPFAVGAIVAATLAFADGGLEVQWAAFVGVSLAAFIALRPLARRLDRDGQSDGIGSRRLIGKEATVLKAIGADHLGLVRIEREEWRAASADRSSLAVGARVMVTHVEGTSVIVTAQEEPST